MWKQLQLFWASQEFKKFILWTYHLLQVPKMWSVQIKLSLSSNRPAIKYDECINLNWSNSSRFLSWFIRCWVHFFNNYSVWSKWYAMPNFNWWGISKAKIWLWSLKIVQHLIWKQRKRITSWKFKVEKRNWITKRRASQSHSKKYL